MAKKIFALLIGINKYIDKPRIPDLQGCVNDVKAMKGLLESLGVPNKHIFVLTDTQATRDRIIKTFQNELIDNEQITPGDTILFFFAGHGNRVRTPDEWGMGEYTEIISPHDQGPKLEGIPARTLNSLFRKLAAKRGNNVTAIFDCCHSGAVTRSESSVRTYPNPDPIVNATLDHEIWNSMERVGNRVIPNGLIYESMESHVLLAACKREEGAFERLYGDNQVHGVFTNALSPALKLAYQSRRRYVDMIDSLSLREQNPQSGGMNRDKTVFDAAGKTELVSFPVKEISNGQYRIEAGQIHGVTQRTEFSIHDYYNRPIGILVCIRADRHYSILTHRMNEQFAIPPEGTRGIIHDWMNDFSILKIHSKQGYLTRKLSSEMINRNSRLSSNGSPFCFAFAWVDPAMAHLLIDYDSRSGGLSIEWTKREALLRNFKATDHLVLSEDKIVDVLNHLAQFRYHLLRHHGEKPMVDAIKSAGLPKLNGTDKEVVQMHMYRLSEHDPVMGSRTPFKERDFLDTRHAVLQSSETNRYGIEISNHLSYDLFPYLFYFDLVDYSVKAWYLPFSPQMSAPLKSAGTVSLGWGRGGDPFEFYAENGATEAGFLKLFISNIHVEMGHIQQKAINEIIGIAPAIEVRPPARRSGRVSDNVSILGMSLAGITTNPVSYHNPGPSRVRRAQRARGRTETREGVREMGIPPRPPLWLSVCPCRK